MAYDTEKHWPYRMVKNIQLDMFNEYETVFNASNNDEWCQTLLKDVRQCLTVLNDDIEYWW